MGCRHFFSRLLNSKTGLIRSLKLAACKSCGCRQRSPAAGGDLGPIIKRHLVQGTGQVPGLGHLLREPRGCRAPDPPPAAPLTWSRVFRYRCSACWVSSRTRSWPSLQGTTMPVLPKHTVTFILALGSRAGPGRTGAWPPGTAPRSGDVGRTRRCSVRVSGAGTHGCFPATPREAEGGNAGAETRGRGGSAGRRRRLHALK